jgi:tRNA (guanine37-N1)-methyltransferase
VKIHAFDINPDAFRYLNENVKRNNILGEIFPHNVNVKDLLEDDNHLGEKLYQKADRIIMNLPESSINFIDVSCFLTKKNGGIVHFYQFSEKPNPIERATKNIESALTQNGWEIESIIESKVVKHYSPKTEFVVLDLIMKTSE